MKASSIFFMIFQNWAVFGQKMVSFVENSKKN